MATKKSATRTRTAAAAAAAGGRTSSTVDELLLAALERGDDSFQTGRFLATFKEGAGDAGLQSFASAQGMRIADARDFDTQAVVMEDVAGADAVAFPEIGVALVSGDAAQERGLTGAAEIAADSPIESIDPEYFVFAEGAQDEFLRGLAAGEAGVGNPGDYLRGFLRAAETIARDLYGGPGGAPPISQSEEEALVSGATPGLLASRVPQSTRSGNGIRVAVLDTGMDLGHPDFPPARFVGRASFVGQPVTDLHSHGTHCIGTACGPLAPAGATPRYGIAHRSAIFVGKVLSNSGSSVGASVLAGMNWAIANRCQVISMSLGGPGGPQPSYTAAGQAALNNGLLIIAAAGNSAAPTGSPANSPTIMSVAALNQNLTPASFSNFGKIDISAVGVNVFSSVPRPQRYGIKSGTSMACPHVAGVAALWAETAPSLRGMVLWRKLQTTARVLPFPPSRVGAGLVQAP